MSNTQQFQNDNLSVKLSRHPGCRIRMDAIISPLAVQASYQKAIKTVGKEVSVPGFRKGKAPQDMILKNFSKHVEKEWKDIVLKTTFRDALELTKVYPFKEQSVSNASLKNISLQDGATLFYEYEAFPEVPSIDPKELSIKTPARKEVKEADVAQAIENLRLQHAEWQEITGRPAAEGDYVEIDIDAVEEPASNICKATRFEVAAGKMGDWMRNLIVGMSPGESAERMSEKEHHHDEECEKCESGEHQHEHAHFKPTLCRITLHAVKKPTLPDLNDELSKKFGINTVEELKKRVADDLNKQTDDEYANKLRALMEKSILNKYRFDVPSSLVDGQVEAQAEAIVAELKEQGVNDTALEAETKKVEHEVAERLNRDFCLYFIAQKVVQDNNIQISQDELMQELMRQVWLQQSGQSIIHPSMDAKEVRSRLYASLLVNKAIDFLIDHSKNA